MPMPHPNPVVSNTTPLITLGEIGLVHVLLVLYTEIWIPQAVFNEYQAGLTRHPMRPDLTNLPWIHIQLAPSDPAIPASLDAGETDAMALARHHKAPLIIIDEQRGRKIAARLDLRVTGALAILLEAKQRGLIPLVLPYLDQKAAQGRRISSQLRLQVLSLAGE